MTTQRSLSVCAATLLAALTLSFITLPAQAAITVVDYWPLGEKDAGATNNGVMASSTDSAGSRTFTTFGSPYYSSSVASAAVTATASSLCFQNSGAGYGTSALISGLTNNFGIELWVNPANTNGNKCLVYNGSSGGSGWGLFQIGATYQGLFGGVTYVGSATATANTWVHLALVRNNGVTTLYTNGVAAGAANALTPNSPTGILSLGASGGGQIFSGFLDEVRVFTFAAGQFNIANLLVFAKPSPAIFLNGAASITNECHTAFTDPVTATGAPLAISGGIYHSLTLKSDGTVGAWGSNSQGQSTVPAGLSNVVAVAGGGYHSLALKSDGTVAAWGENFYGQRNIPAGLSNVVAIAAGEDHSLALKSDGTVVAWGSNGSGQRNIPVGLSNVIAIAARYRHNLALKSDGTVVAWGYNSDGQTTIPAGLSNVVAIAGGTFHSLALKSNGTVVAWGYNGFGQTNNPVGLSNVVAIAAGDSYNLVIKSDGTVAAWGQNLYGQTTIPGGLSNVVTIASGYSHSLALKSDGTLVAWGRNGEGQANIPAGLNTLAVTVSGSVNTNAPGTYLLNYTATNSLGSATASRTVVVRDTAPPVLTLLGNNPLTNVLNDPFVDPGATALDTCSGSLAVSTNSTVNVGVVGSYTVTYTSTDNFSNTTSAVRTVVVVSMPSVVTLVATGVSNSVAALNGMVNPGGLATFAWFEWTLPFGNTNVTAPVVVGSGAVAVTVSNLLSGFTSGITYHYRAVGSNALGVVRGNEVSFGSPALSLNGGASITNECHTAFTDPVTATGVPLAIAGGVYHSLALKSDGTVAAWGDNTYGQANIAVGLSNVVAIAGGGYHSLVLKSDRTVTALLKPTAMFAWP